ncbi:P-II family nitrogen regulator [Clostridium amazonitimonense]|uniref:P-II family nitrogen regulator n=1 Tax=Clostridium amazonitimonense TaxID=1499689 RepID=UPI000509FCF6|nr:P-II family nitrogen regulator [Clostridium amazonitimonense]
MFEVQAIIVIVDRGKAHKLVQTAKKAGAKGATIFYGRGTGESEGKKFFNLDVEPSKEVIIILSEKENIKTIKDAVVEDGKLREPGTGIIFTIPVSDIIGLHHRED